MEYSNIHWIDFDTMENFMVDVFKGMEVPVNEALEKDIIALKKELKLSHYSFPFEKQ